MIIHHIGSLVPRLSPQGKREPGNEASELAQWVSRGGGRTGLNFSN